MKLLSTLWKILYLVSQCNTFYVKVQSGRLPKWLANICQVFDSSITEIFHLVYLKRSLEVTEIIPWLFADWLCSWCFFYGMRNMLTPPERLILLLWWIITLSPQNIYLKISVGQKRPNHSEGNFNIYSFRYHDILMYSALFSYTTEFHVS